MKISSEFSKYAIEYSQNNIIQKKVLARLLKKTVSKPSRILDLGCGDGILCKEVDWCYEYFAGVDFAQGMLDIHPKGKKIESIYGDFNSKELFETLLTKNFDYLFSSSALQWSNSLDEVFKNIKKLAIPISLSIFTSGTFKTLNKTASLKPLLKDTSSIVSIAQKYFDVDIEVVQYKLEFDSTREMFRYIKKSGVSASRNILSYKETRKLMKEYPLNYLEFEVVFITSRF